MRTPVGQLYTLWQKSLRKAKNDDQRPPVYQAEGVLLSVLIYPSHVRDDDRLGTCAQETIMKDND